jgi:hypothetical protein
VDANDELLATFKQPFLRGRMSDDGGRSHEVQVYLSSWSLTLRVEAKIVVDGKELPATIR